MVSTRRPSGLVPQMERPAFPVPDGGHWILRIYDDDVRIRFPVRRKAPGLWSLLPVCRGKCQGAWCRLFSDIFLVWHEVDHRIRSFFIKFCGVCVFHAAYVTGKFDDRALHAEAQSQEGDAVGPGIADGVDLAFHAPVAEASRYYDAIDAFEDFPEVRFSSSSTSELIQWIFTFVPKA